MAAMIPSTALVPVQPVFADAERLALAGFLAGYRGLTREAYTLDLRQFSGWCRARSLPLFSVRRADIETFAREMEARAPSPGSTSTPSRKNSSSTSACLGRASLRGLPSRQKCGARRSSSARRATSTSTPTPSRTRHKSLESPAHRNGAHRVRREAARKRPVPPKKGHGTSPCGPPYARLTRLLTIIAAQAAVDKADHRVEGFVEVPLRRRTTWPGDKCTAVRRRMIRSMWAASSPRGHRVSRRHRRRKAVTARTSARFWTKTAPMARLTRRTPTVTPTRSRLAPSAPATEAPRAATTASATDNATKRRHHGPAGHGLVGAPPPELTEGVHRGDHRSGRQ
jgi:hypothetical protein